MTVDETIGANVHELLWRRRLRQGVLLEAMGLSRSSLAKKLRGEIAWSARDVDAAARTLSVEPGALFGLPHLDSNQKPTDFQPGSWAGGMTLRKRWAPSRAGRHLAAVPMATVSLAA